MDTKRAIKFLRNHFKIGIYEKISKEIIALIKQFDKKSIRGEKYEAMWREMKKDLQGLREKAESNLEFDKLRSFSIVYQDTKRLEQKYFPKPSDNFTEKVMDKINNEGER